MRSLNGRRLSLHAGSKKPAQAESARRFKKADSYLSMHILNGRRTYNFIPAGQTEGIFGSLPCRLPLARGPKIL